MNKEKLPIERELDYNYKMFVFEKINLIEYWFQLSLK